MGYIEEEREKIIKELLDSKKVKAGQLISYTQFLELYETYRELMSEKSFAELLGISNENYKHIKNDNQRTRALTGIIQSLTDEIEQEIIQYIEKKNIKPGQRINYVQFLILYDKYKDNVEEIDFANIIGISDSSYYKIKEDSNSRTIVLKSFEKETKQKEQDNILNELQKAGKIKPNQKINYKEFLELYKPYKSTISEREFARILLISDSDFSNMKYKKTKVKIINYKSELSDKEIKAILNEIKKMPDLKPGQIINYEEFLILYGPYKHRIKEKQFAEILGINSKNHGKLKRGERRARILKEEIVILTEEEKCEIIEKLMQDKDIELKAGDLIDYECFLGLYKRYGKNMSESEFAKLLDIKYKNYQNLKNKGSRARILKSKISKISDEEKKKIIKDLEKTNKIKIGIPIEYSVFLEIYEPYKKSMSESEFAEILGISYSSYSKLKTGIIKSKIRDKQKQSKLDRVVYTLKRESRYYSIEELEDMCEKYSLTIEDIIGEFCNGEKFLDDYREVLKNKGKIWIGKTKCSKKFAELHSQMILRSTKKFAGLLCLKYYCKSEVQDIASKSIVYVLDKCGDVDKNFVDDEKSAEKIIKARIYYFIKYECLKSLGQPKVGSFYGTFTYKGNEEERNVFDRGIKDDSQNVQDELEEKELKQIKKRQETNPEETYIELLMRNIESGLNREEALLKTAKVLGITPQEMLKLLQKYMIEQKRVRETEDGDFVLGG